MSEGKKIFYAKSVNIKTTDYNNSLYKLSIEYGWGANILVSTGKDGILLVDTGYRSTAIHLLRAIRQISNDKIMCIINSHYHGDHIGGNCLLNEDGIIYVHGKSTAKNLVNNRELIVLWDQKEIEFNNRKVCMYAMPGGHSVTDIVIHFPEAKILYLGDIYLSESFPTVKSNLQIKVQNLIYILKKILKTFPEDTLLVSGHGKDSSMSSLAAYLKMIEETIKIVTSHMKQKKNLLQIKKEDVLKDYGKWGQSIEFINKESWISDIYLSYMFEIRR